MMVRSEIAYVIDPRFPGGTSTAVAAELEVVAKLRPIKIYGFSSQMFKGREVAPTLQKTLERLELAIEWDPKQIGAETVIFHNPSCLKFENALDFRIVAHQIIAVTHENFLRPGKIEGFDVHHCLSLLESASFAQHRRLAAVSTWNRKTIKDWFAMSGRSQVWQVIDHDWFNICNFEYLEPSFEPRDRRGRLSRPGFEKFPDLAVMDHCFPKSADANVILGGELLANAASERPHWDVYPFRSLPVDDFFSKIDFMIYYGAATSRESFGRILVEAVAAGKIAISDAETASAFGGAVLGLEPSQIDRAIASYLRDPETYRRDVKRSQDLIARFSPENFATVFESLIAHDQGVAA